MAGPDDDRAAAIERQRRLLPPAWRRVDRAVMGATEVTLFVIGALFALMVTLEVVSRYAFDFSIFFVNAAARMLLVWFFLLGAGPALRQGAHVGFELVLNALGPRGRRIVVLLGYLLTLIFLLEIIWSGAYLAVAGLRQSEPGLGISLFWLLGAIPAGFMLLTYHLATLAQAELRRPLQPAPAP